ncbi:hypothetical protein K501DRAFT_329813 [Backusella circina FSU 941]|nr:hypothetical protein K501DRAFT_329813 [Backusella circina FSU 941]
MLSTEEEQSTTLERTFAVVKTDSGTMHQWIENQGFNIIESKLTFLNHDKWESFKSHQVYVFILEKANAVNEWNDTICSNDSDLISKENAYGSPTIEQAIQDISLVFNDQTNKDTPQKEGSNVEPKEDGLIPESNEKSDKSNDKASVAEEFSKNETNDDAEQTHEKADSILSDVYAKENHTTDVPTVEQQPLDEKQSIQETPMQESASVVEEQHEEQQRVEEEEPISDKVPVISTDEEVVPEITNEMVSKEEQDALKDALQEEENALEVATSTIEQNRSKMDEKVVEPVKKEEQVKTRSNELRDDAIKPSCSRLRQPAMRRGNSLIHSEKELTRSSAKKPTGSTRIARLNTSPKTVTVSKEVVKPKKKKMAPDFISRLTAPTMASKNKKAEQSTSSRTTLPIKKSDASKIKKRPRTKNEGAAAGLATSGSPRTLREKNGHTEIKTN